MDDTLLKSARRRPLFDPTPETLVALGPQHLEHLLPHRPPMRLVDAIDHVDLAGGMISGEHTVAPADPFCAGHFPDDPVYPGVLVVEAVGQVGLVLQQLLLLGRSWVEASDRPQPLRLLRVKDAWFLSPVRPGDRMTLVARSLEQSDYVSACIGQALVGGQIVAVASFEVLHLEEEASA